MLANIKKLWYQVFLGITVWFWLAPIIVIPSLEDALRHPWLWLAALGACSLAGVLGRKRIIVISLVGVLLWWRLYPEEVAMHSLAWWRVNFDQDLLLAQLSEWELISEYSQTLMFFLCIVVAVEIYRWLANGGKNVWLFWVVGIASLLIWSYLGGQSFWLLVGYTIIGLFWQIVWTTQRLVKEQANLPGRNWLLVATTGILLMAGMGIYIPQPAISWETNWELPVQFPEWELPEWWPSLPIGRASKNPGKVGYGGNDQYLGGPFVSQGEIIMEIKSPVSSYWRGEAKEVYTGAGWTTRERKVANLAEGELLFAGANPALIEQEVTIYKQGLAVAVGLFSIQGFSQTGGRRVIYTPLERFSMGNMPAGFQYKVLSLTPEQLSQTNDFERNLPSERSRQYLELPASMPARVIMLADRVTRGIRTPFGKAKSIEIFLQERYRYETVDLAPVDSTRDFVDQFLFESRRGYCDYFSTAMVVMARAIGIPARWVKGFTPGEVTGTDADGNLKFTVRDYNAHSWVEVYIAGFGWIAMDPTPSFELPNIAVDSAVADLEEMLEDIQIDDLDFDMEDDYPISLTDGQLDYQPSTKTSQNWVALLKWGALLLSILLLIKWLTPRALQLLMRKLSNTPWGSVVLIRMALFSAAVIGRPRKPWETLREFALRWPIPGLFPAILCYERVRYQQID